MSKALVIAEKPDVARNYVEVLKKKSSFQKKLGYFESSDYIVTYGFGHLLNSKNPMDYDEFGGWNWESIPFYPPNGKLDYFLPNDPKLKYRKDQLKVIKDLMNRKDVDTIINACDAGREGDMIFWEIYDYFKSTLPVKRLWISSLTEEEVVKGFSNLRDEPFFIPRREAAYARQYADWFLGHNLTTGFTVKVNAGRTVHVGRVQTPTLALLVKRREEIENFVPKDYFVIEATFGDKYKGTWFKDQLGNIRFDKEEEAKAVVAKIKGKNGTVVKKDVKKETVKPKALFNLNDLQREGNKKFGFSAQKVLDLAQVLYEKYKYLSYPRTDSRHLGKTHVPELEPTLKAVKIPAYDSFVDTILSRGIKTSKDFIDDSKVSDHHAIIPTKQKPDLSRITDEKDKNGKVVHTRDEILKIYDVVVRRFLSIFYPPAVYEKTEIVTESEKETFKTSGKILIDAGWEEVYGKEAAEEDDESDDKPGLLPPIAKGEVNPVTDLKLMAKKTQPPKHYTEADLLAIMENPKRLLEDKELQDALAETGAGLGTPATRAQTIENLVFRKYVAKKGKQLIATDDGVSLIKVAPEELKSPEITADWEQKLSFIQEEKMERGTFEKGISEFVVHNLEQLKVATISVTFQSGRQTAGECPKCKKAIVEFPQGFACESTTREAVCFRVWKKIGGKSITANQFKQMLDKGSTSLIKGFKSKSGSKFDAKVKINENFDGLSFVFADAPEPKETGMSCPKCRRTILDKGNYFACESHSKEEPCFTFSKVIASKTLTEKQVSQLLQKGKTDLIKGFKGKSGKSFDAILKLENLKLEFEFPKVEQKDTGLKCPSCGNEVRENDKAFGCSNYKNCKFTVWKVMSGRKMTEDTVKELIIHKKTQNKLDGFIGKTKKPFSAYLVVESDGSVKFSFN